MKTKLLFVFILMGCSSKAIELQKNNLPKADGLVKPTNTAPFFDPTKISPKNVDHQKRNETGDKNHEKYNSDYSHVNHSSKL